MYKHLENTLHQEDKVFQGKTTLPYSDMFLVQFEQNGYPKRFSNFFPCIFFVNN